MRQFFVGLVRRAPIGMIAASLVAVAAPAGAQVRTATVHSLEAWVFVSLTAEDPMVDVANPATSDAWDLAVQGTQVMVNGEDTGPANMTAACLCENEFVSNDQLMTLTPETQLARFEAVNAGSVPASTVWHPTIFATSPWFKYNLRDEHMIWPYYHTYLVKRGEVVYKMQIINYYDGEGQPRHVTFRWAPLAG
jgi:hypothetical protein